VYKIIDQIISVVCYILSQITAVSAALNSVLNVAVLIYIFTNHINF